MDQISKEELIEKFIEGHMNSTKLEVLIDIRDVLKEIKKELMLLRLK